MVSKRLLVVMLAALALSVGACGGDDGEGGAGTSGMMGGDGDGDGDGDGASNDVPPNGICARVAAIQCAAQEECCTDPDQTAAECMDDALDNCEDLAVAAADPIVGYDRAAMKDALDEFEMLAMACDTAVAQRAASADGFISTFKGTVAAGGDCTPEGGAENAEPDALVAALASCMNSGTTACLPSPTTWTCTARAAADGKCFTDLNCQDGLYCDTTAAQEIGDGACTARKASNAACNSPNECSSFVCKSGNCGAIDDAQEVFCY